MSQTRWILALTFFFGALGTTLAQQADTRTLFTVEDTPVTVDEFTYIYSKTNGEEATFSEESLQEYLDLYVKFKLKVERAKEMRLDTIKALQEELAGYRRQLADSYLIDRAIGDRLIEEAYQHMTEDVDISHILFGIGINADPKDTLVVYNQAVAALRRLKQGEDFESVARQMSMDKYSRDKGGRVGFITALLPAGLHNLEYAAYQTPIGEITGPIRTTAGYHILKVHDRRPARGEMEAAHILIRNDKNKPGAAKVRIDSIYQLLQGGASFDALARTTSEDTRTARNGGYLGFFGINRYEKPFEDAAFSLTEDDSYSQPFESSLGWHIIKRISRKAIQPFEAEKPRLEGKVRQDPRFEDAKAQLLRRIRQENNFRENTQLLDRFVTTLPDTFTTFRWKAPAEPSGEELFRLGEDYIVTLGMFTDYLGKSTRQRVTYAREGDPEAVARKLYEQFIDDQLLKYEETQLEKRYPEFRSLMREYEEGILLFEATKLEVWDRAAQDSTGLQAFYDKAPGRYRWAPRAVTTVYRVGYTFKEEADEIRDYARRHTAEEVKAKFNTADEVKVTTEAATVEKFRNPQLATIDFEVGGITGILENRRARSLTFTKIEDILPAQNKTLQEARGYVIADYQDYLEQEWVKTLREKYAVKINQKVFKSLIR